MFPFDDVIMKVTFIMGMLSMTYRDLLARLTHGRANVSYIVGAICLTSGPEG